MLHGFGQTNIARKPWRRDSFIKKKGKALQGEIIFLSLPPPLSVWNVIIKSRGTAASCLATAMTLQKNATKGEIKKQNAPETLAYFLATELSLCQSSC